MVKQHHFDHISLNTWPFWTFLGLLWPQDPRVHGYRCGSGARYPQVYPRSALATPLTSIITRVSTVFHLTLHFSSVQFIFEIQLGTALLHSASLCGLDSGVADANRIKEARSTTIGRTGRMYCTYEAVTYRSFKATQCLLPQKSNMLTIHNPLAFTIDPTVHEALRLCKHLISKFRGCYATCWSALIKAWWMVCQSLMWDESALTWTSRTATNTPTSIERSWSVWKHSKVPWLATNVAQSAIMVTGDKWAWYHVCSWVLLHQDQDLFPLLLVT